MLDSETKRRIDTARDILVGKVPDPKSQVEQITIALIYKFMDDMDSQAEELGGKRKFFADEFARYGWAKLMAPSVSGYELIGLYGEGIAKMPENPGIPPLFRNIFKNAYLPYRDPETLKAFLKTINDFTYDHSEKLGDAFEYLLSVLGSQGEAGQFRTPRHIIDFMVAIVDPKKSEAVLDPACGTAGFLISSYKHILRANSSLAGVELSNGQNGEAALHTSKIPPAKGDLLTPDERKKLADNFRGYDISPDMVRLSLVNMYLHGFTDPHVYEYDTLTSQDRWNEMADVILANPPFMSPKGGIKPHNRFSVPSKRSEVLFVDYMAEHLTPGGRAGIIVPEGIIFQSQTAYKTLRKMLVEQYLVAVVSLPAGVFNPYSGVKTSLLLLDKLLAKQSDTIGFFKVENDGFNLGAQRRPIDKNDLPQVLAKINEYLRRLRAKESVASEDFSTTRGLIVAKEKIAANGVYSLSGERFRDGAARSSQYPHVALGEVVEIFDSLRRPITKGDRKPGPYPYYGATGVLDHVEGYLFDESLVLVGEDGAKWGPGENSAFPVEGKVWVNNHAHVLRPKREVLLDRYLIELLNLMDLMPYVTGVTVPKLNQVKLRSIEIPLPPLEVQKEIVAEIVAYQKVIDGARAVLDHYRPHIPINPEWPMVELGEIIEDKPKNGYSAKPVDNPTELRVLTLSATSSGKMDIGRFKYTADEIPSDAPCRCKRGDIYLQRGNTRELVGTAALFDTDEPNYIYPDLMIRVRADEAKVKTQFLLHALQSEPVREFISRNSRGSAGSMPKINQSIVEEIPLPLPPLDTQRQIVAEIEAEQRLVEANRQLIERMEQKIAAAIARIWGDEATAKLEA